MPTTAARRVLFIHHRPTEKLGDIILAWVPSEKAAAELRDHLIAEFPDAMEETDTVAEVDRCLAAGEYERAFEAAYGGGGLVPRDQDFLEVVRR